MRRSFAEIAGRPLAARPASLALASLAGLLLLSCGLPLPSPPTRWSVLIAPDAPEAVRVAAEDVATYLGRMGLAADLHEVEGSWGCGRGGGRVVFVGEDLEGPSIELGRGTDREDQAFGIREERCRSGRLVYLYGGGLLGRQYAAYEWLHALGVRFFHPEEELVPEQPSWPEEALVREHLPDFRFRSASLHLTHPLELGDAFRSHDPRYLEEGRRYIDWLVKNGASDGHGGVGTGALSDYGLRRGFPRSSGFRLYGAQQGSTAILDPDDPRSDEEQILAAIEERMEVPIERRPSIFSIGFDPTEFTEADDRDVVRQLSYIADTFAERYPETILLTTNHGTHGEPTEHYGVRYYDLPQFAPPNLGVKVHTLMFYDVFRPAPVYGNEDFTNLYEFMDREHAQRRIWYFPESAWWLTFDLPVPLYLPITIEARDRDIQGIRHMLEGGLDGHRVFGSGHEWGYWQNEYCSFRMAMDVEYRYTDCLADIAAPMGEAASETQAVLEEVIASQERDLFEADLIAYIVGTDNETELAASIGFSFHPLPETPERILAWEEEEVRRWDEDIRPRLATIEEEFAGFTERLREVRGAVPANALPFFDEVLDGVEIYGVRAAHQRQLYGALVDLRASQLRSDPALAMQAEALLAEAFATTEVAQAIIRRREGGYRYSPIERSIAGGPDGTEDENWTIYNYRYLNRTHHAFYFRRQDRLAEEAFLGAAEPVQIQDALLGPDEELVVRAVDPSLSDLRIDYGDGEEGPLVGEATHRYAAPGVYELVVTGSREGEPIEHRATVASLIREYQTGFSGRVVEPEGASLIEGVLPGVSYGPIDPPGEGARLAMGFSARESGEVRPERWQVLQSGGGEAAYRSAPAVLQVPVINRTTGAFLAALPVLDGVGERATEEAGLSLRGALRTEDIVTAVVSIGGFEENGARAIVASTLGYTPETLPETVPFLVEMDPSPPSE